MSGVTLQIHGLDKLNAMLDRFAASIQGRRPELLAAMGAEVESQTRRRIQDEKTSPAGGSWPGWSPRYAATRHGGQSLLQAEGGLLDSIQSFADGDGAEVGSNLVYAAIHQFGGAEVGSNIPARPYLGVSDANAADLEQVARDWLTEVVNATGGR
ncbi:phage virion morphogenesis protein [Megalodesulfovibrio paquesii]